MRILDRGRRKGAPAELGGAERARLCGGHRNAVGIGAGGGFCEQRGADGGLTSR